ncbi:MAG: hypothetical protein EP338_09435 [Bacteroidetes bacterium]|nr:MAG: hypothetical protein EP338_09435 [Bacteroidota bacterium]
MNKALTLALSLLIFISCNKNASHVDSVKFENPYSSFGQQHNDLLILANKNQDKSTKSLESIFNAMVTLVEKNNNEKYELSLDETLEIIEKFNGETISSYAKQLNQDALINEGQLKKLIELDGILATESSEQNMIKEIRDFDFSVANDNSMTEPEKKLIYIASSVARSSSEFWASNQNTFLNDNGNKASCKRRWCIAALDVVGAVAGAVGISGTPIVDAVVLSALASVAGKCCFCCPGSCPNVEGLC